MKFKIINDLAIFLDNIVPEKFLSKFQEFLLSGAIFTEASNLFTYTSNFHLASELAFVFVLTILNLAQSMLILSFSLSKITFNHVSTCLSFKKSVEVYHSIMNDYYMMECSYS